MRARGVCAHRDAEGDGDVDGGAARAPKVQETFQQWVESGANALPRGGRTSFRIRSLLKKNILL